MMETLWRILWNLTLDTERSITMRNVIVLPLLALIGFGFCLAFNMNLTKELMETREQLARAQSERQTLEAQYLRLVQANNDLSAQISARSAENAGLQRQLETIKTERRMLSEQVTTLQNQMALFRRANPLLDSFVSSPVKKLAAVLLLPVVPISLGAIYVRKHTKRAGGVAKRKMSTNDLDTYQVALTREELNWIERQRRA
jgi:hypothetical protein